MSGDPSPSSPELAEDELKLTPRDRLRVHLTGLLKRYDEEIDAFRELLDVVAPHAAKLDADSYVTAQVTKVLEGNSPDVGRAIKALFERHLDGQSEYFDIPAFMRSLFDEHKDDDWFFSTWQAFDQMFSRSPRLPIVLNSLLITTVSSYEALVAQIVTEYYKATPEALEAVPREKEKEFSLKDLKSLGSLEEAVDLAVSRRVDELLFGSFLDWRRFFKERLNLELADLASDWEATQEVFQRRHAIVHNGGRASRRYVEWVGKNQHGLDVEIGDRLHCDEDYLRKALDRLFILGSLLVVSVALKFEKPVDRSILEELQGISYNALVAERWSAAKSLCLFGERRAPLLQDQLLFKVNRLIAEAELNGKSDIQSEVEAWDVSALEPRFKFAKACLLQEMDEAFGTLATLVAVGDVSRDNLLDWPLLREMRKDSRFQQLTVDADESDVVEVLEMSPSSRIYHVSGCERASSSVAKVEPSEIEKREARPCKVCRPAVLLDK